MIDEIDPTASEISVLDQYNVEKKKKNGSCMRCTKDASNKRMRLALLMGATVQAPNRYY